MSVFYKRLLKQEARGIVLSRASLWYGPGLAIAISDCRPPREARRFRSVVLAFQIL